MIQTKNSRPIGRITSKYFMHHRAIAPTSAINNIENTRSFLLAQLDSIYRVLALLYVEVFMPFNIPSMSCLEEVQLVR